MPTRKNSNDSKQAKFAKAIMKSYRFHVPHYDLPLRLRPWFLVCTCIIMIILAFLGFTDFSRSLPLNDKILHFVCFALATGVFYFIMDIEEPARRIWFWRYFPLLFTILTCFLCGGILSEVVQSALPYKEFQIGDVIANLFGAALGLLVSYHLEKYYRHRREIARLYQPLDSDSLSDFEDDLDQLGTQLLPTHHTPSNGLPVGISGVGGTKKGKDSGARSTPKGNGRSKKQRGTVRFADVWDNGEREELFDIGEVSEEDDMPREDTETVREPIPGASQGQTKQARTESGSIL